MTPLPSRIGGALTAITFAVSFVFSYGPDALDMSVSSSLLVSAAAAGAVWLSGRRAAPALALAVTLALGLPLIGSTFAVMDLVLVFVVFQVVMHSRLNTVLVAGLCLVALTVNDAWQRSVTGERFMDPSVLYPLLLTALSVGLGVQSRRALRQHAELVLLRDADRRRAVSDERRRIARDIHDVAAHHLSALVVRNTLARRVGTAGALDDAAAFTSETAGEALDALRQVVHVLNTEGDAPLTPASQLSDIDEVVARMAAAGLRVERRTELPEPIGGGVDAAVVGIVTEAMANVLRHRGPGWCWLEIERQAETVALVVEDDGPSTWRAEFAGRRWHAAGHYGLIGMHERAEACGGRLDVGPSALGGWRVSALLPAPAP